MVGIVLMKHEKRSAAAEEIDARSCRVVENFIRAACCIQSLNHLSRIRVYNHKFSGIDDVPTAEPAAHEQPMVSRIQPPGVTLRPPR